MHVVLSSVALRSCWDPKNALATVGFSRAWAYIAAASKDHQVQEGSRQMRTGVNKAVSDAYDTTRDSFATHHDSKRNG